MALKQLKLKFMRGKKQKKCEKTSLLKSMKQAEGGHVFESTNSSYQSGGFPDLITPDFEVSKRKVLNILGKILSVESNPEDTDLDEVVKTWNKVDSFPEQWRFEYLQVIDQYLESHFPMLPAEGPPGSQLQAFLKSADSIIRLATVLKDVEPLDQLIYSCIRHLFTKLDLLLYQDLSVNETFYLLMWGKDVFFSQNLFRVDDPLLLVEWFDRAIMKLLLNLQDEISGTLQRILHYDQKPGCHLNPMDEEAFIRVHLDVSQCLNAVIQNAKKFSETLTCKTQELCLQELLQFVQNYVHAERKRLKNLKPLNTNSVHLFQVISTCRQLRFLAPQLNNPDTNESDNFLNINCVLKEMEDHVLSFVQTMMKDLAQDILRRYFKNGDHKDILLLIKEIQNHRASLPQTDVGKEIREICVNVAYDCVSHVYLDCLVKSKRKHLERRWGDVGERMKKDALTFSNTFTELNGSDDQNNQLLQRMSEVLCFDDVEALKLVCAPLFRDFPNDSQQYVPGLLRWKGVLSKRQVRKVLKVQDLDLDPSPRRVTGHPLKGMCCCLK